ncbi:hypothetical protein P3S67_008015 [Capsicum chacoense]
MASIADDITIIILSNLPVKSLLRFKCVSKSWFSWISDPKFELSNAQRQQRGAISLLYNNDIPSFLFMTENIVLKDLIYPFNKIVPDVKVGRRFTLGCNLLGSCHGLLLINVEQHIFLWNPTIGFCTKVLELDDLTREGNIVVGGLCFDDSMNEYKALLFIYSTIDDTKKYVIVASLKDKKWRKLEFSHYIPSVRSGVALNGRLHFIQVRRKHDLGHYLDKNFYIRPELKCCDFWAWKGIPPFGELIYFDSISEKFHKFPVPRGFIVGLGVLNECLCVACLRSGGMEILVMKEYGKVESWTSTYVIKNFEINPYFGYAESLFMTEDGEELVIKVSRDQVVAYNLKDDSVRQILVRTLTVCISSITYVPSLISPQDYNWRDKQYTN